MPSNFCEFSNREQTVYAVIRAHRVAPEPRGRDSAQRKPETPNAQTAIPGLLRLGRLGSNGRDPARTAHDKLSGPTSPVRHRSSTATTPPRRGPGAYATVPAVTSDGTTVHDGYPPGPTGERTAVSGPFTPHLLDVQEDVQVS